MLQVDGLHFSYGAKNILNGVTFSAAEGELIALIGVSGSGKTTLFRLMTGLITPQKGTLLLGGLTLPQGSLLTTYMRQDDLLLPWRTVMENLLLFAELGRHKKPKETYREEAALLLQRMGLKGVERLYPKELSGGMRQRVSLARSLLQGRPILLLDEPFASLDVIVREELYKLVREIRSQYQKTILLVTHDFRDALSLADRILVLAKGKIQGDYRTDQDEKLLIQQIRGDLLSAAQ